MQTDINLSFLSGLILAIPFTQETAINTIRFGWPPSIRILHPARFCCLTIILHNTVDADADIAQHTPYCE
jgi:hypothetical protein